VADLICVVLKIHVILALHRILDNSVAQGAVAEEIEMLVHVALGQTIMPSHAMCNKTEFVS
jgi:hypothetical protein